MRRANKKRICLITYHRDKLSLGVENEQKHGLAIFHWALLVRPKDCSSEKGWTTFDTTDTALADSRIDQNISPEHQWRSRAQDIDPFLNPRFLGGIVIDKLAKDVTASNVHQLLAHVTLPRQGYADENCVSWARDAVLALQKAELIEVSDIDALFDAATQLGMDTIRNGRPMSRKDVFLEC